MKIYGRGGWVAYFIKLKKWKQTSRHFRHKKQNMAEHRYPVLPTFCPLRRRAMNKRKGNQTLNNLEKPVTCCRLSRLL